MLATRVIPVLLIDNHRLVKTINFNNAKYLGDPVNAVRIFNEKEVDEIVILDITATRQSRRPDFNFIQDVASEAFMPLAYGGGVHRLSDVKELFRLGVEKVVVNSALLTNPHFISEASRIYGTQSIVASIDVKKNIFSKYKLYKHDKKQSTRADFLSHVKKIESLGVGEIFLNSVDRDGTMKGYDTRLISTVSSEVNIPVVACGGAASLEDLRLAVDSGASAVAAGSLFVFSGPHRGVLINYPEYSDITKTLK